MANKNFEIKNGLTVAGTERITSAGLLTGTTTTQAASDNTTKLASTAYVTTALANLADSAPSTLNTLNELAAALGDDANYSTTTTAAIAAKAPLASPTLTGTLTVEPTAATGLTYAADGTNSYINFEANSVGDSVQLYAGQSSGGFFSIGTKNSSGSLSEKMRVSPIGNVGIDETDPLAKLHVVGGRTNGTVYNTIIAAGGVNSTDGSGARIILTGCENDPLARGTVIEGISTGTGNSHKLNFKTNNGSNTPSTRMTIGHTGNVGIGTDNPSSLLEISKAGEARLKVTSTNNNWAGLDLEAHGSQSNYIFFRDNGAERARIQVANGNEIIFSNGSSPAERMRIDNVGEISMKRAGSGGSGVLKALNLNHAGTSVNDGAKISFTAGTSSEGAGISSTGQAFNSADLRFYTGGNNERMRIKTDGNVGIGPNGQNPQNTLHIATSSNDSRMQFTNASSGSTYSDGLWVGHDSGQAYFMHRENLPITFWTNTTEKMRLKANGGLQLQSNHSTSNRKEEVFHSASVGTSYTDFFSVDIPTAHRSVFYEIITFGSDWSGHSAARSYYKGFQSGTTSYTGDNQIENSGAYGSGSHIDWVTTRSGTTVTFRVKVYSGSTTLEAYIRIIGTFGNITLL